MFMNDTARKGLFGRFVAGLARTRQGLVGQIERLFGGNVPTAAHLETLEELLIAADFGPALAQQLMAPLQERLGRRDLSNLDQVEAALKQGILAILNGTASPPSSIDHQTRPQVLLFLGINGSGKTTTIGKLANRLISNGGSVVLAGADTFRAAAIEQLQLWGRRVGADVISHQAGADPSAVVFDAPAHRYCGPLAHQTESDGGTEEDPTSGFPADSGRASRTDHGSRCHFRPERTGPGEGIS